MNQAPYFLYYTRKLPTRAVGIAYLSTPAATPNQLTSVNNTIPIVNQGSLTVQQYLGSAVFTASDLNIPVTISGSSTYLVDNQFFEITDQADGSTPYFYSHILPTNVNNVTVSDVNGVVQIGFVIRTIVRDGVSNNYLLHNFVNEPMTLRYVAADGVHKQLLLHTPVIRMSTVAATSTTYTLVGTVLNLETIGVYYLRFTAQSGYQILPPFNDLPNVPWYARIRFSILPPAPEWANQNWLPFQPYVLGTWITGTVVANNLITFERSPIYFDGTHYPSILVYDSGYNLKYALSGESITGTGPQLGYDFPWRLGQIQNIDPQIGTVQIALPLDPTDIVFGFYSYVEPDIVYRLLDINPATNPAVRNREVQFIYDSANPTQAVSHLIIDTNAQPWNMDTTYNPGDGVIGSDNNYYMAIVSNIDIPPPNDEVWQSGVLASTQQSIGLLMVGTSISTSQFTITDVRQRGGGLGPAFQSIPEAMNFWDLGFWDGEPFPLGGALVVYLPIAIQSQYTTSQLQAKIESIVPMGVLPVIRYYDQNGVESA